MTSSDNPKLRSRHWYGKLDKDGFIHRSWMKNQGFPSHAFSGKPVIGICNTWSELTPCNSHLRTIAEAVKRGVWEAGGFPVEFPVMSLGETQIRPTAMLFRNLLAMETEEAIRAHGMDGVVLLGGCDKTTPGQLMGAFSVDLPTLVVSSGPMLNGKYRGQDIGSGTDVWKFSEAVRSGKMSQEDFFNAESGMSRSPGVCMTMGTASTMACIVEAMGLSLPDNGTLPAVDARRNNLAHLSGMEAVQMVRENRTLASVVKEDNFYNAIVANAAIGGSTNAVVHLLAMAGRAGINLRLEHFDKWGSTVPLLVNCMPSGKYLMEDFCYAGGMRALLNRLAEGDLIRGNAKTVTGKPLLAQYEGAECFNDEVIYSLAQPLQPAAGIKVLTGNLAPKGAVIKPSAASPHLLKHRGKAVVFENIEDLKAKIDDPNLAVTKDDILVLKGCGPKGYPGMPEVGNMPLPKKILAAGVNDMIRISDARMSGTAFGTVVLHVSPEAMVGGVLAVVENGDEIELDAHSGTLNLLVSEEKIAERLKYLAKNPDEKNSLAGLRAQYPRGYYRMYIDHVMGADTGADLDFLVGKSSSVVTRESH